MDNKTPLRFTIESEEVLECGAVKRTYIQAIAGSEREALAMMEERPHTTYRIVE